MNAGLCYLNHDCAPASIARFHQFNICEGVKSARPYMILRGKKSQCGTGGWSKFKDFIKTSDKDAHSYRC